MATLDQIEQALRAADAAGNTDDAKRLAQAYADMRGQVAPQQPRADSSSVRNGTDDARAAATQPAEEPIDPTEGMSGFDKFAAGMGKSFVDSARGLKQSGTEALGYVAGGGSANPMVAIAEGVAGVPRRFDNAVTRAVDRALLRQQATIDEGKRLDAPLMDTGAGVAGNVAGYAAQVLAPAAGVRGLAAARVLLPTTVAGNSALGAVQGALQPTGTGGSRAENAAIGAAFGSGGAYLAKGLGAMASNAKGAISEAARAIYQAAKERGITLTPVQLSDSNFLKRAQGMLRNLPFTGAQARYASQVDDLNRQVAKTIGEDAPRVDSQVYARAKQRQSDQFSDLTARNAMKVDDRLVRSLTNIADGSRMAGEAIQNQVESAIDALYAQATTGAKGVVIPGEAYQAFDAQLNQIIKGGGAPAHFLGNIQKAVRRAMDDSISPEDSAAWKALRREYGNRKTIAPLVAKASDEPLTPASLMGAVTNSKSGKEAMASGARGELGELAKIGQRMKPPPSSGTAENILAGGVFNPVNWPAYAAGIGVGAPVSRLLDSEMLTRILMRENPGMTREVAAQVIRRAANPAGQTYVGRDVPAPDPVPRVNAFARP